MRSAPRPGTMSSMSTTPIPIQRLRIIPVADSRPAGGARVRRYRLARLAVNRPRPEGPDRFEHLKHAHD